MLIRSAQTERLKPISKFFDTRGTGDVEGALLDIAAIKNQSAESLLYLEKRLNYVMLLNQLAPKNVLEVGFNFGYSASLILDAAPGAKLTSIDLAEHDYTKPSADILRTIYGERLKNVWGDSREVMAALAFSKRTFDFVVIDGGHSYDIASSDITLGLEMLDTGGIMVVDDTDAPSVRVAVVALLESNPMMIELTPSNIGLFEHLDDGSPCFEQRYFVKL